MGLKTLAVPNGELAEDEAAILAAKYQAVRRCTEQLCEPLVVEDYVVQSMPEARPDSCTPVDVALVADIIFRAFLCVLKLQNRFHPWNR